MLHLVGGEVPPGTFYKVPRVQCQVRSPWQVTGDLIPGICRSRKYFSIKGYLPLGAGAGTGSGSGAGAGAGSGALHGLVFAMHVQNLSR